MYGIFDENPEKRPKRSREISSKPEDDNLDCPIPSKIPKYKESPGRYRRHLFHQERLVEQAPSTPALKP